MFLNIVCTVKSEIFTSSLKLCEVLHFELLQLEMLENTFVDQKKDGDLIELLEELRRYIPKEHFHEKEYDIDECLDEESKLSRFVTNPTNAYMLIKRFHHEWRALFQHPKLAWEYENVLKACKTYRPHQKEIRGTRDAFYRLGAFYELEARHMATGLLSLDLADIVQAWTVVPKGLTANDMLEIGKVAFGYHDYHVTVDWMTEAYKKFAQKGQNTDPEILFEILDYLSWSEYSIGKHEEAFEHSVELIKIHPENERIQNNLLLFNESKLGKEDNVRFTMKDYILKALSEPESIKQIKTTLGNIRLNASVYYEFEQHLSQFLCKYGQLWKIDPENMSSNRCFVKKGTNHYGKLLHANVEQIFHNPDAFLLREMVDEQDILHFKKLAREHLTTATIHNPVTGLQETADYRITQSSWFDINSDPYIRKMVSKLRVATGLTLKSSEDLQLANYGIGGYYDNHFDFATRTEKSYKNELTKAKGNRLATYLLYMSDVTIGGRTGFDRLGISVAPSKGDALFWYNLLKDTTGDARTRHIACPVALGTKWVGNFWIRTKGEELSRPCDLTDQDGI